MGTPHKTDFRLTNLVRLNETITKELVEVFQQAFLKEELDIGEFGNMNPMDSGVVLTIVDSEFENVVVHLLHKQPLTGNVFEIKVELLYLDSPVEWKIQLDDHFISMLPERMILEMESKLEKLRHSEFSG